MAKLFQEVNHRVWRWHKQIFFLRFRLDVLHLHLVAGRVGQVESSSSTSWLRLLMLLLLLLSSALWRASAR